jgi:hypothetical protein
MTIIKVSAMNRGKDGQSGSKTVPKNTEPLSTGALGTEPLSKEALSTGTLKTGVLKTVPLKTERSITVALRLIVVMSLGLKMPVMRAVVGGLI